MNIIKNINEHKHHRNKHNDDNQNYTNNNNSNNKTSIPGSRFRTKMRLKIVLQTSRDPTNFRFLEGAGGAGEQLRRKDKAMKNCKMLIRRVIQIMMMIMITNNSNSDITNWMFLEGAGGAGRGAGEGGAGGKNGRTGILI